MKNLKIKGSFHYEKGYYYFRNIDDRILLGGGRNMDMDVEKTTQFGINQKIKNKLLNDIINLLYQKKNLILKCNGRGLWHLEKIKFQLLEEKISILP